MNAYTQFGYGDSVTWGGRMPYNDKAEAFDEAVVKKVDQLMKDGEDFCPRYLVNIAEALADLAESDEEAANAIEHMIIENNKLAFDLIENAAYEYCVKQAKIKAEKLLMQ
jgi:hypothetical protein